jgi:plastocyanin
VPAAFGIAVRATTSGGTQIVMTSLSRHPARACLVLLAVVSLAGCVRVSSGSEPGSSPGGTGAPSATLPPRPTVSPTDAPSPTPAPTATPDDGATPIEVTLLDSMQIKPGKMTIEAGKPVRFIISNEGALEHDFFLGSDREQKQRESGQGEPGPDRYVQVPAGETVTLLYTFPSDGRTIAGCVVPGHYSAGMKANITIE